MENALKGVTVLEVGVMTPGKYCGFLLSGWGVESIRVERPGQEGELSTEDLLLNRGKQSIALNLRAPEGREILLRLCENADVLIESYRPGVMTRLGIDYDTVRAVNDTLVYCSLSGFGQNGPDHMQPAYDLLFQARSGLSHLLTEDVPFSPKTWLADSVSGLMAAFAISAALRQREVTGAGTYIDLAMLDSLFSLLSVSHGTTQDNVPIAGVGVEDRASRPAYNMYRAGDGRYLALAAARNASCRALFTHLGRPDLAEFALVSGDASRAAFDFLTEAFLTKPARDWIKELSALDIEIAPVNTPEEAFDDPQLNSRGMISETIHPSAGTLRQIGVPAAPTGTPAPAPAIGHDTATILRTLGYDEAKISDLRTGNVI
jgi:crotonobetainyl-CoA:carnitine CoA-transferase CaiB-like acyl-CoA transferase